MMQRRPHRPRSIEPGFSSSMPGSAASSCPRRCGMPFVVGLPRQRAQAGALGIGGWSTFHRGLNEAGSAWGYLAEPARIRCHDNDLLHLHACSDERSHGASRAENRHSAREQERPSRGSRRPLCRGVCDAGCNIADRPMSIGPDQQWSV